MAFSIEASLDNIRSLADTYGLPTRRKDESLYRVLGACLTLCEEVQENSAEQELKAAVRKSVDFKNPDLIGKGRSASNNGKGRRYTNSDTDVYILTARFALEGIDNRSSTYRYAKALRCAAQRMISGEELPEWLKKHGGVRSLSPEGVQVEKWKELLFRAYMLMIQQEGAAVQLCAKDIGDFLSKYDLEGLANLRQKSE